MVAVRLRAEDFRLRLWDLGFMLYPVDKPGVREVAHLGFREA